MFYYIVCIVYTCVWIKIILFEYICIYVCTEMLLVLVHVQEARGRPDLTLNSHSNPQAASRMGLL